jgi:hypothetical protein
MRGKEQSSRTSKSARSKVDIDQNSRGLSASPSIKALAIQTRADVVVGMEEPTMRTFLTTRCSINPRHHVPDKDLDFFGPIHNHQPHVLYSLSFKSSK